MLPIDSIPFQSVSPILSPRANPDKQKYYELIQLVSQMIETQDKLVALCRSYALPEIKINIEQSASELKHLREHINDLINKIKIKQMGKSINNEIDTIDYYPTTDSIFSKYFSSVPDLPRRRLSSPIIMRRSDDIRARSNTMPSNLRSGRKSGETSLGGSSIEATETTKLSY